MCRITEDVRRGEGGPHVSPVRIYRRERHGRHARRRVLRGYREGKSGREDERGPGRVETEWSRMKQGEAEGPGERSEESREGRGETSESFGVGSGRGEGGGSRGWDRGRGKDGGAGEGATTPTTMGNGGPRERAAGGSIHPLRVPPSRRTRRRIRSAIRPTRSVMLATPRPSPFPTTRPSRDRSRKESVDAAAGSLRGGSPSLLLPLVSFARAAMILFLRRSVVIIKPFPSLLTPLPRQRIVT